MELIELLKKRLVNNINLNQDISDDELRQIINSMLCENDSCQKMSARERSRLSSSLFNSIRGLDVLQDILEDDDITEIMINGPDKIFIEKKGKLSKLDGAFSSYEKLADVIQVIVGRANKRVNEADPIVDTRLPDGSRVNVVLNPIAINGPIITIRKFPKDPITMKDLVKFGSITTEAVDFLKMLVMNGFNIFISGGTGSGKTTFLNALSDFIPKDERIITIEDSAELQIKGVENLVRLECRSANVEGENAVTIRDLIRSSLRMRPNRIIVGEVRGEETLDMLQAMNTGHDGSLSTGHGNSPADMLSRLETMVLMGCDMPLSAIKNQIASALDVIVHLGRTRDGGRKVFEITEILDVRDGVISLNPLFTLTRNQDTDELKLQPTGNKLLNTRKLGIP